MIHQFTQKEFEDSLPKNKTTQKPLWELVGSDSELLYKVEMGDPNGCYIFIRSSISPLLKIAHDSGDDSIRLFIHDAQGANLVSKSAKLRNYITRVKGWDERMWKSFSYLRKLRQLSGDCPVCGLPNKVFRIKYRMSMNYNELFAKCRDNDHYKKSFRLITKDEELL